MWHRRCPGECRKKVFSRCKINMTMCPWPCESCVQIKCTWISNLIRVQQLEMIRGRTVMISQWQQMLLKSSVSPPSPWFHSLSTAAGVRKTKKKESYVKASQSESNHWPSTTVIGLITVHQMQLSRHSYKILQQEIHSAPFNLFQKVTTLRGDQAPWCNSPCLKTEFFKGVVRTERLLNMLHLLSSLKSTAVIILVFWASCCFQWITVNYHRKHTQINASTI